MSGLAMSVLSSQTLRDQLSEILGSLTRAAVEEILGLVGAGYTAMQAEIVRSHKENQDLRKKLNLIESILGRGGGVLADKEPEPSPPPPQRRTVATEIPDVVLIKDEDSDSNDCFSEEPTCSESQSKPSEDKKASGRVFHLDSPASEPGCSTPIRVDSEAGTSQMGLYAGQMDPERRGSLMESDVAEVDVTWSESSQGHGVTFPHYGQSKDSFGLVMVQGSVQDDELPENFQYEFSACGDSRTQRFICNICTKTYATSQNLAVHMRTHTGERPFSCTQCGKKFTQSAHLKSHLSIHSGMRPFNCSLCSRGFISKYSLRLHMKKRHSLDQRLQSGPSETCRTLLMPGLDLD